MVLEEEYTDYSCSTAIERLSRDVETLLRVWHVDKGSDRHVSTPSGGLIRSNPVVWHVPVWTSSGRSTVTVDLELALWDAPPNHPTDDDKDSSGLVQSLKRRPVIEMEGWFDHFSNMFGIGQHISLSPIRSELPASLRESLGNSILQRHAPAQAPFVLSSILGNWLQTALNCAVANCHCCIPVFGIWGPYQPHLPGRNHHHLLLLQHQESLVPSGGGSISHSSLGEHSRISDLDDLLGTTVGSHPTSKKTSLSTSSKPQVFPPWLLPIHKSKLPSVGRKYQTRAQKFWNQQVLPPVVSGSVICPAPIDHPATMATMSLTAAPSSIAAGTRLAVWGNVLLEHCPDNTVVLEGAKHVFGWFKPRKTTQRYSQEYIQRSQEWRQSFPVQDLSNDFTSYRKVCQAYALDLLDEAWRNDEPLWGPSDDPVASVYATTTWKDETSNGLLTFPLRIRSRRKVSPKDWVEMEESVERTILDPLNPSRFTIQVDYDRDTPVATLAARQRCILAALIRAATLPGETLLPHLTDEDLVGLWDDNAGTIVANKLAEKSRVGSSTRQIVNVMDWSSIMDDVIPLEEAEALVHRVMSGDLSAGFPMSPEESFNEKGLFSPFPKSAPWGRLLSVLFAHMARLRSLSSMALVWGVFVEELRRRWETRESLPNMQYVSGLDPHPLDLYEERCFSTIGLKADFAAFLNCSEPDPDDYHCLIGQKLQVFNLGVECIVAQEIMEHEAMERFLGAGEVPTSAFLSGIDTNNTSDIHSSIEMSMEEQAGGNGKSKWPRAKSVTIEEKKNYGPPTINSDLEFWVMDEPGHTVNLDEGLDFIPIPKDDTGFDFVAPPSINLDHPSVHGDSKTKDKKTSKSKSIVVEGLSDQAWEGKMMEGDDGSDDASSIATSCGVSQVYYDAAEAGSIFSMKNGFVSLDTVVTVADVRRRPGARCPVQGIVLRGSGDQLYAPYLQRPFPLTDDLVLERRVMLAREQQGDRKRGTLQGRLNLSHRLQKPKLLSDMSAFKAANPGSTIDDFTRWYGNPGNPLDDYVEVPHLQDVSVHDAYHESAAKKLDKASEAMKVLIATRDFWSSTWEEATPIPAAEQQPLFDFISTVEMVIDYLEQMHPSILVNQVMAVNLSSAYFTLIASAENALNVGLVEVSLQRLRRKIDDALRLLSHDATGALFQFNDAASTTSATSNQYSSGDAIYACEVACNALSATETMIARATSLLHKFPGQYNLVQDLLRLADGSVVALTDPKGRSSFLAAIHNQQKHHLTFTSLESLPKPLLREYVLRNLDAEHPCQLSVRFGDEGAYLNSLESEGGILLALMKSYRD